MGHLYRPGRQRSARPLARSARDNRSPAAVATPPIRGMLRPRGPCGARPLAPAVPDGCHRMGATPPPRHGGSPVNRGDGDTDTAPQTTEAVTEEVTARNQ